MSSTILVKRHKDKAVFSSDMSSKKTITEIHFCTSYTQVFVQEDLGDNKFNHAEIICEPIGSKPNWIDLIAIQNDDTGVLYHE